MGSILDGVATLEEAAWAAAYIAALRKQPVDAARVFASKARSLHRLMWTSEEEGLSTIIDVVTTGVWKDWVSPGSPFRMSGAKRRELAEGIWSSAYAFSILSGASISEAESQAILALTVYERLLGAENGFQSKRNNFLRERRLLMLEEP